MIKLAQSHIRAWSIVASPLAEEVKIVKHLDYALTRLDTLVGMIDTSAALLREYRSALVSAGITGTLDVSRHSRLSLKSYQ
jgi:type I restriction enzyme, S subunit